MKSNSFVDNTSIDNYLSRLYVSPSFQCLSSLTDELKRYYYSGLQNVFSTINATMAKEENAHVLAFDLYNSRVFERNDFYEKDPILSKVKAFLHSIAANFSFFECRDYHYYQEAFMMSARVVTYLYRDRINDSSDYLFFDRRTLSEKLEEVNQKTPKPIDIKKVYEPIIARLENTDWRDDNCLYVLINKEGTGITDKFLTNEDIHGDQQECSPVELESDAFTSKQKIDQIVTYQDRIDGIRKIMFDQEILKLLASQYAYFDNEDLFLYLFSNRELLTYNIPANVITHKKILISFIDLITPDPSRPQRPFYEYHVFFQSIPRKVLLKSFYEFLMQKQHELFKTIFEDQFDFTYRFIHLEKPHMPVVNIREEEILAILTEDTDYEGFRTSLVLTYPEIFYYDHFYENFKVFDPLKKILHRMRKEKPFDLCIVIICFQGNRQETKEIKRSLEKFVSGKCHIITAELVEAPENPTKFEINKLKGRRASSSKELCTLPSYLAFETIKTIIAP